MSRSERDLEKERYWQRTIREAAVPIQARGSNAKGAQFQESREPLEVGRRSLSFVKHHELSLFPTPTVVVPGRAPTRRSAKNSDPPNASKGPPRRRTRDCVPSTLTVLLTLCSDLRFQGLLRRMNFQPQGQAAGFSCQGFEVRSQGKGSRQKAGGDSENGYHGVVPVREAALDFHP